MKYKPCLEVQMSLSFLKGKMIIPNLKLPKLSALQEEVIDRVFMKEKLNISGTEASDCGKKKDDRKWTNLRKNNESHNPNI